jgi:hypothetical protein
MPAGEEAGDLKQSAHPKNTVEKPRQQATAQIEPARAPFEDGSFR